MTRAIVLLALLAGCAASQAPIVLAGAVLERTYANEKTSCFTRGLELAAADACAAQTDARFQPLLVRYEQARVAHEAGADTLAAYCELAASLPELPRDVCP